MTTSRSPGSRSDPLRIAIVGSGPSAFYAAGELLRADPALAVEIDMFERLPTPWGLVRAGVAPDHPSIKTVSRAFEATAALPGFRFYGNVALGRDIAREDLTDRYHGVIYAIGAHADRRLGIPGESLPGSWAANEFVGWYNGHPDYRHLAFDLGCRRAVVIGNGNVAMDIVRMLARDPEELTATDVADHALDALRASAIEEIVIVGRRGPAHAAFTTPELRELAELPDVAVVVDPVEVLVDDGSAQALACAGSLTAQRNVALLRDLSRRDSGGKRRRVVLRFLRSPVAITGGQAVEAVELVHTELHYDADGTPRARATERRETIEAGLVLRSIGYRGLALDGVPFDEARGTIPNEGGRVRDPERAGTLRGEYAVGWIKRGPCGLIGTNKRDAQETVGRLFEDLREGRLLAPADPTRGSLERLLRARGLTWVSRQGWEAIDEAERAEGASAGRPRVKLCTIDALLTAAGPLAE